MSFALGGCIGPPPYPPIVPRADAVGGDAADTVGAGLDGTAQLGPPCQIAEDCPTPTVCRGPAECSTSGTCSYAALDDVTCDDGDLCTIDDLCKGGLCVATAKDCNELAGPCATSWCDRSDGACKAAVLPDDTVCDSDDQCTIGSVCAAAVCVGGVPKPCSDGNECTVDACEAGSGACLHTPVDEGAACSDSDACTAADGCHAGLCLGYAFDEFEVAWWTRLGGEGDQSVQKLVPAADGSLYIVGVSSGAWGVGPTPEPPLQRGSGSLDAVIARLSPSGAVVWERTIAGTKFDLPRDAAANASGRLFVSMSASPDANLGTDLSPVLPLHIGPEVTEVLAAFDDGGALAWARGLSGAAGYSAVAASADGGVRALIQQVGSADILDAAGKVAWPLGSVSEESTRVWLADYDMAGNCTRATKVLEFDGSIGLVIGQPQVVEDAAGAAYVLHPCLGAVQWGDASWFTVSKVQSPRGALLARINPAGVVEWGRILQFSGAFADASHASLRRYGDGLVLSAHGYGPVSLLHAATNVDAEDARTPGPAGVPAGLIVWLGSDATVVAQAFTEGVVERGMWVSEGKVTLALASASAVTADGAGRERVVGSTSTATLGSSGDELSLVSLGSDGAVVAVSRFTVGPSATAAAVGEDRVLSLRTSGLVQGSWWSVQLPEPVGADQFLLRLRPPAESPCAK